MPNDRNAAPRAYKGVMVSSTFKDLKEHRAALIKIIEGAEFKAVGMESDSAKSDVDVIESSLRMVDEATAYIGIIAKKLGQRPKCPDRNPEGLSITELEFNEAVHRDRPILLFIMGADHPVLESQIELDPANREKLGVFRERAKRMGPDSEVHRVYAEFSSLADFERKAAKALADLRVLLESRGQPAGERPGPEPPRFKHAISRGEILEQLLAVMRDFSIVAVEGLSGIGKTYLVAECVKHLCETSQRQKVYWHNSVQNEVLDDLLIQLSSELSLTGASTLARCRQLYSALEHDDGLLVVDDFQHVQASTYAPLIDLATRCGKPARLMLVSQTLVGFVEMLNTFPEIAHFPLKGFSSEEAASLLRIRNVGNLGTDAAERLVEKTDGLPLACSLFATLVKELGFSPSDLLDETMDWMQRLQNWFQRTFARLSPEGQSMLSALSLSDGPFNIGVVRMLGSHLQLPSYQSAFEHLLAMFLVQIYSPHRWKVHELLGRFSRELMPHARRIPIHQLLARHYLRGLQLRRNQTLNDDDFRWAVRACRQWEWAEDWDHYVQIVDGIAHTAKLRGHYSLLAALGFVAMVRHENRSRWIDYHVAHCYLILGRLEQANATLDALLRDSKWKDAGHELAVVRLYAELLASQGRDASALGVLSTKLANTSESNVSIPVWRQAKSTEAWLKMRTGNLEGAKAIALDLLARGAKEKDVRGTAVAHGRLGSTLLKEGRLTDAAIHLANAAELFKGLGDQRGAAWTLAHLAECNARSGSEQQAQAGLLEATKIASNIGECSVDYIELLERLSLLAIEEVAALAASELSKAKRRVQMGYD